MTRRQTAERTTRLLRLAAGVTAGLAFTMAASGAFAWSYKEAAAPYKGTTIRVLDETTPLQETFAKLVPKFIHETGINVKYELLNHFEVISKGQSDMLSGRGYYDAVMNHSFQLGLLLDAGADAFFSVDRSSPNRRFACGSAFHAAAEPARDFGGREGMQAIITGNREVFAEFGPGVVDGDKPARLFDATMAALEKVSGLLDTRREEGFVRRCHGDLHLRNVVMIADRPVLFDAIEFNDAISHIDVLYDFAFLLMDLDHRGLRRLANIAFNSYLDVTGDVAGLPALPLFLSVRAAIRAHVAAAMVRTVEEKKAAADELRAEARAYLDMALEYLAPPPPRLVAVGGLSGSGKSRLARELAPYLGAAPGARVARSDVLRKRLQGAGPLERLGPQGYTAEMTEKTYRAVFEEARKTLEAGHSAIADAVFAKPRQRTAAERLAGDLSVPFDGLWLEAPEDVMTERVESRKDNASDADAEIVRRQLTYDLGPINWRVIDSSASRKETLAGGLRILGLNT